MTDIDSIRINLDQSTLDLLNFCLAFLTFGVALDIEWSDFRQLLEQPKKVIVGLISQWLLLPLLTLGLIYLFQPAPTIALGMVMVAACPGGNVSNYTTHLAQGNTALSVTMTSLTTLLAIFTTPLIFWGCAQLVPGVDTILKKISLDPLSVVVTIVELIVLPLLLGLFLTNRFPGVVARIKRYVKVTSMAVFLGIIVGALLGNLQNIENYLHLVFWLVLAHNGLAYVLGYFFAKANKMDERDRRAISLETGIHNSGLGLILIFNFFTGLGGMALMAAWWGVWDLVSSFALAMWWKKRPVNG